MIHIRLNTKLLSGGRKKEEEIKKDRSLEELYISLQPRIKSMPLRELSQEIMRPLKKNLKGIAIAIFFHATEKRSRISPKQTIKNLMQSKSEEVSNGTFLFKGNGNSKTVLIVLRMGEGQGENVDFNKTAHYEMAILIPKKNFINGKKDRTLEMLAIWRRYLNPLLYDRRLALSANSIRI